MEVGRGVGDCSQVSHLASMLCVSNGHGDGFFVHIKSDESTCGVHGFLRETW
jgi:hypothetical protein